MNAAVGDWLVMRGHTTGQPMRRAQIVTVADDGRPPYTVRWADTGHEVIMFPGPDAEVVTSARLAALDRSHAQRIVADHSTRTTSEPRSP